MLSETLTASVVVTMMAMPTRSVVCVWVVVVSVVPAPHHMVLIVVRGDVVETWNTYTTCLTGLKEKNISLWVWSHLPLQTYQFQPVYDCVFVCGLEREAVVGEQVCHLQPHGDISVAADGSLWHSGNQKWGKPYTYCCCHCNFPLMGDALCKREDRKLNQ